MAGHHMTARVFLAREIRLARVAKGMSRAALGRALYVSESLVAAWESARYVPKPDQLEGLETVLGTGGVLARMVDDLVKDEAVPEFMGRWLTIEKGANQLLTFEPMLVPGLLQTDEYAREVITRSGRLVADVEERVRARMSRQAILAEEDDVTFVAVIDQAVLHRPVVGPEAMRGQLARLREVADQQNAYILVVPDTVGAYAGCGGGFVIAAIDGREVVYVDDALSADILEGEDDVSTMKRVWESLRAEALPAAQSADLIEKAMKRWT